MTEAAGRPIRFALSPCSLGLAVVACSDRGVCAVEFGDAAEELTESLRTRFPGRPLVQDAAGIRDDVVRTLALIEEPRRDAEVVLDTAGTEFQRIVWSALREIPPGETRTYHEIAKAIGRPTASRAVATACASNRLAVLIPCHRVVRSDGSLSGYRWGVDRKRILLERERLA